MVRERYERHGAFRLGSRFDDRADGISDQLQRRDEQLLEHRDDQDNERLTHGHDVSQADALAHGACVRRVRNERMGNACVQASFRHDLDDRNER